MIRTLTIGTHGKGLREITGEVREVVAAWGGTEGLCTVFVRHTSCSLLIQENADPSARRDLEEWFERHVPEGDAFYTHTAEGPDDMPSHIRAALTAVSVSIPIQHGCLMLGRWQGVYLFEHRRAAHSREVVVHIV